MGSSPPHPETTSHGGRDSLDIGDCRDTDALPPATGRGRGCAAPSIGSIAYTRNMAVQAQHLSNSTFSPDFRGW
ncbi:hypothetical protein BHE74_00019613 [Ensete ventricosum]|nr:hypothetical protein BHE74_00019613 [Ensete ventricosum]